MRIFAILFAAAILLADSACSPKTASAPAAPAQSGVAAPLQTPIDSLQLSTTVVGAPRGGDPSTIDEYLNAPPHMATVVILSESGGQSFRLLDDVRSRPTISRIVDGRYAVSFAYQPENGTEFSGRRIDELRSIASLGTRYAGVLAALGIDVGSARIDHLTLTVNGRNLVSANLSWPVGYQGSNFQTNDLSSVFQGIPSG